MIDISLRARRDFRDVVAYFDEQTGSNTIGDAFVTEFQQLCSSIESFPSASPLYTGTTRRATLHRFSKYRVFYREVKGGVRIIRVLHGMRDLPLLLR